MHGTNDDDDNRRAQTAPVVTTRAEWRAKIIDELGGDGVDQELSEPQLDAALRSALELWNKHRPDRQWFPFDVPSTGANETFIIKFFADPERTDKLAHPSTFIRNVISVDFQDVNRMILGPRALGTEGYYLRWGHEGPRLFFEMQSAKRTYERLSGSRPDWQWEPNTRRLYISSPSRPVRCMVLCTRERTLEQIPYDYVNDFRQSAVARAKYYLARVLGSRTVNGGIPGPAGAIVTDAEALRRESKEEWDEIKQKLEAGLPSMPPPGYIG